MDKKQIKIHPLEDKTDVRDGKVDLGNLGLYLSNLPFARSVRRLFSSLTKRLPEVSRSEDKHVGEEDTELEAAHRRHDIRGSINAFTERVWDAVKKPQRVDESLRKQSLRTKKDEEVQRRQEEIDKRNILITRISRQEGYVILVEFLKRLEAGAYFNLRFPESRKEGVTLDYYIAFQNGTLWTVENIRGLFAQSIKSLKKQNATRNKS